MTKEPTQQRLMELFDYDPATGVFRRLVSAGSAKSGSVAGFRNSEGYLEISVDGRQYKAHRLAVLYMTGEWPAGEVDHANGAKDDNRFCNLRECTHAQNLQNLRRPRADGSSGFLGVSFSKAARKWRAYIRVDGAKRYLGLFPTPEEASAAYLKAKRESHAFCTI